MCFNYGLGLPKDELEIMRLLKLAADDGHAEAMRAYAHRIVNFGANPDYSKVASLLREAAGQGHALAQCNLGLMFKNGELFPIDYQRAMVCFQLAAEQGNSLGRGLLLMIEKKLSKLRR
jgi:TPR repeat protein